MPVTYADVWEFWMEHRGLAEHVSFVTIHILPYWEDHPVAIDVAIAHIVSIAEQMRAAFGGKDVLIGETGWPSAGRSRRAAVASRVNQARFFRQFSLAAAEHNLRYNFIEAFDQPWKRRMEGAMGGQWGLVQQRGRGKVPRHRTGERGSAMPHRGLVAAAAGLLAFVLVAARRRVRGWHLLTAAASGRPPAGAVLAAQWQYMVVWNRYATEWAATGAYAVLALAVRVWSPCERSAAGSHRGCNRRQRRCRCRRRRLRAATIPPFARCWPAGAAAGVRRIRRFAGSACCASSFLFGAAAMALLLVFDARYRGFPVPLYALPLMSLLLLLAAGFRTSVFDVEEAVLATIILVCALAFIPMERLSNLQALPSACS